MQYGSVRVEGLTQTLRALEQAGAEVSDLKSVMGGIAAEGASLVARYAPRRSGRLAGTARGNKAKAKAVVLAGRARVPYAGPINYGWPKRGIKAALYMQRADRDLAPKAVEMLDTGIDKIIKNVGLS